MKNSSRYILIFTLLALSWWLQNILNKKPELIIRDTSRFADYYLEDFKLTAHNKSGLVKYTLQAKRLDNYEQESLAEIQDITAEVYNKQGNWTITADKALLYHNKNIIEFSDNVKIIRPQQPDRAELNLQADTMTLLTEKEILTTNGRVTLKTGKTTLESKGLRYNNLQGILELQANVKGSYVK